MTSVEIKTCGKHSHHDNYFNGECQWCILEDRDLLRREIGKDIPFMLKRVGDSIRALQKDSDQWREVAKGLAACLENSTADEEAIVSKYKALAAYERLAKDDK